MSVPDTESPAARASGGAAGRLLFAAALVVGLLRFFRLSEWSLWIDEALTLTDYYHGLDDGQIGNPLGYLVLGGFMELVAGWRGGPVDELALRLLPALCGYAAVPLTFWVLRPLGGARVAGLASLLVAVSPWHVYWSQTARFYTMVQVVALVGTGLTLRAYFDAGRPFAWRVALSSAGLVLVALGGLLHPSCLMLLPALIAAPWVVILCRADVDRDFRRLATWLSVAGLVCVLAASPWAWKTWTRYRLNKPNPTPAHFVLTTGFYLTPLWCVAAAAGLACAWIRRQAWGLFLAGAVASVLAGGLFVALFGTISAQYVFVALPLAAALAAVPLELLGRELRGAARPLLVTAWAAALALPALADTSLYFFKRNGERSHWREAYEYVFNERGPDDLVFGMAAPVGEFYIAPGETYLRNPEHVAWLEKWRVRTGHHSPWAVRDRRTWFVLREEWIRGFFPEDIAPFRRMLREECRLVKSYPLWVESRDLSVHVYVRD